MQGRGRTHPWTVLRCHKDSFLKDIDWYAVFKKNGPWRTLADLGGSRFIGAPCLGSYARVISGAKLVSFQGLVQMLASGAYCSFVSANQSVTFWRVQLTGRIPV